MRILVTGGAGYVGTTLVPLLLDGGHEVVVFDLLKRGVEPLLPMFRRPGFSFTRGDIRDLPAVQSVTDGCDAVVHLAAIPGYPSCARDPDEARSINVLGTENVATATGPDRPLIFASTGSCYGQVKEALCTEDTPLNPVSLYGETKAQGEEIVHRQCNAIVYRIATAYGLSPAMRLDLLINDFVYLAVHQGSLRVYEGHFRRSFIHVCDIARAVLHGLENSSTMGGRTYNVGDESGNHTKTEVCEAIRNVLPETKIEVCTEGKDADQRDYAVSYSRIKATGYGTSISLEEGIRELCSALRWIERD